MTRRDESGEGISAVVSMCVLALGVGILWLAANPGPRQPATPETAERRAQARVVQDAAFWSAVHAGARAQAVRARAGR